jgi:hypothetical protein
MTEQVIVALIGVAGGLGVAVIGWWGRLLILALRDGKRLPRDGVQLAIYQHERNCPNIEAVHRAVEGLRKDINGLASRWDDHIKYHLERRVDGG